MRSAGDVAADADIVGLVGQNQPGRIVVPHQSGEDVLIGGVAANEPMVAETEDVASARDCDSARRRRKGALFVRRRIIAEEDLIDLGRAEAGNLDRRLIDDELLELDFEILKAPGAVFAEPVERDAQQALLGAGQMPDANAGDMGEAQLPGGLDADRAVDDDCCRCRSARARKSRVAAIEAATSRI